MTFCTTRNSKKGYSFEEVLFRGVPEHKTDGLFVPVDIPSIPGEVLVQWSQLSFRDLVVEVARRFIPENEVPKDDLCRIVHMAYEEFPDQVIPIIKVDGSRLVAELFHGPSLAFKDLAMFSTGLLLDYFLQKRGDGKRATVLVSTSGDTGPSCLAALRKLKEVNTVVIFPSGRVSPRQALQMTNRDPNEGGRSAVLEVMEATSDSIDEVVFKLFSDEHLNAKAGLCSLNSVNWSRIIFQIPHYFYVYFHLHRLLGTTSNSNLIGIGISVPTGAMGNAVAGLIAMEMGLPLRYLLLAQNENDCAVRFVQGGILSFGSRQVVPTIASAIDILAPYNVERFIWILSGKNCDKVREWMSEVEQGKEVRLEALLQAPAFQGRVIACTVSHSEILSEIATTWETFNYCIDPHTAVGMRAASRFVESNESSTGGVSFGCLATAHPAKFPDVFAKILETEETEMYLIPESLKRCSHNPRRAITVHQRDLDAVLRMVIDHMNTTPTSLL